MSPDISQSLSIGQSFLPLTSQRIESVIDAAVKAAEANPEVATEITLAATNAVLLRCKTPKRLLATLQQLMDRMCEARDHSLSH
jgi:hypothetical protein